jgi:tetratricopeptide (TPR) repeat protein
MSEHWTPFPTPDPAFDYAGERLREAWPRLHAGDREPFPDRESIAELIAAEARLGDTAFGTDAEKISAELQDAWRAFHRGEFREAFDRGMEIGPLGHAVAITADGVQAFFLQDKQEDKLARYQSLAQRAGDTIDLLPLHAGSHYRYAWALGLLARMLPAMQVLADGLGSKLHAALDAALELDADHAEAHTALGLYFAEAVSKLGSSLAKMTLRVDPAAAEAHLRTAIRLTPDAPNAWIGLGIGLGLLDGKVRSEEREAALARVVSMRPLDARETLEIAYARKKSGRVED